MGNHGLKLLLSLTTGFGLSTLSSGTEFIYTDNTADKTISGYSVGADGSLTPVPGSPFPGLSGTLALTIEPRGRFLYVLGISASTLLGYRIESNGALTAIPGSPFAQSSSPQSIAADPTGKFLYIANLRDSVSAYQIDTNGALTSVPGSPFAAGYLPTDVVVEPKGEYVYELNLGDSTVWGYHIESNGALVPTVDSPFGVGYPTYLSYLPDYIVPTFAKGELVYIMDFRLQVYSIQCRGALVQFPGLPLNVPVYQPSSLLIDPKGEFAFVIAQFANQLNPVLVTCRIGDQGDLTPIPSTEIPGTQISALAIDSSGAFLFLINGGNGVTVYGVGDDGSLTPVKGWPFATGNSPSALALTPNSRHPLALSH